MDTARLLSGMAGSLLLILGAGCHVVVCSCPYYSLKNWLYAGGNTLLAVYALLGYLLYGQSILFVAMQPFLLLATMLMLMRVTLLTKEIVMGFALVPLLLCAFVYYEGVVTAVFMSGVITFSIGFALEDGTVIRNVMLLVGVSLLALLSTIKGDHMLTILAGLFFLLSVRNVYEAYQLVRRTIAVQ
jgi:hypothetical protein